MAPAWPSLESPLLCGIQGFQNLALTYFPAIAPSSQLTHLACPSLPRYQASPSSPTIQACSEETPPQKSFPCFPSSQMPLFEPLSFLYSKCHLFDKTFSCSLLYTTGQEEFVLHLNSKSVFFRLLTFSFSFCSLGASNNFAPDSTLRVVPNG